jgi:hypothetical protein
VLRVSFPHIGRIERATGFKDEAMLPRLLDMLKAFHAAGRDDLLRDVRAGRLTLRQCWEAFRLGRWERLPTAQHALPFAAQFNAWRGTKGDRYARYAKWVATALGNVGDLANLRPILLKYRAACETAGKGSMFNHVMATVRAFLRDTMTVDHQLYRDLVSIGRLKEPPKRRKAPQRPEQAAAIREALGGDVGRVWWILACTGMLPDEYFAGKWAIEDGRLHVNGTKRVSRDRYVPLLTDVSPTALTARQFQTALRKSGFGVRPKDGRDSFALWCDLARLPVAWKRALMGHEAGDITLEYGFQESEKIVDEATVAIGRLLHGGQRGGQGRKSRSARLTPAQAAA